MSSHLRGSRIRIVFHNHKFQRHRKDLPMVKDHIQRKPAIELLVFKIIVSVDIFDDKIWNRIEESMKSLPK